MRIVYDNFEYYFPIGKYGEYNDYEEFSKYLRETLIEDFDYVEKYCEGGLGDEYENELKFKPSQ